MIYPYLCRDCGLEYDVEKPVAMYDSPEICIKCESNDVQRIYHANYAILGAKSKDAYYDVSLGKVIMNEKDRKETMKIKDVIEIGSETKESLHKHTVIAKQKEKDKQWDDL